MRKIVISKKIKKMIKCFKQNACSFFGWPKDFNAILAWTFSSNLKQQSIISLTYVLQIKKQSKYYSTLFYKALLIIVFCLNKSKLNFNF